MTTARKHTSNPIEINLHKVSPAKIREAACRFLKEDCRLKLNERQANNHFTFEVTPGKKNGHQHPYQCEIYRGEDRHVHGRCTCAAFQFCKHLAECYLEAQALVNWCINYCEDCGAEFEGPALVKCFECFTAHPQKPLLSDEEIARLNEELFGAA
jgi:hypothetical protein